MRLIDADELIPLIKMGEMNTYDDLGRGRNGGIDFAINRINQMPTIEEREKGRWVGIDDKPCETFECDRCGFVLEDWIQGAFYNFCPNCGAEMRGAKNEKSIDARTATTPSVTAFRQGGKNKTAHP